MPRTVLAAIDVADDPAAWAALGFRVGADGAIDLGGVAVRPRGRAAGRGIVGAAFAGAPAAARFDGLPVRPPEPAAEHGRAPAARHPNGATTLDHVVVTTPAVERTAAALADAGLDLRATRDVAGDGPLRQAFLLAGPCLVEVVGRPGRDAAGPAAFWGMTIVVADLDALAAQLGPLLGTPRDAVQPGRRIATLRAAAGLSAPVACITPRLRRRS